MSSTILRRRRRGIRFAKLTLTASWSTYDADAPVTPPDEDPPGSIEPWHAVTACRPDTAHSRALRFIDMAGEALASAILIIGGAGFTGFASLIGGVV